MIKTTKSREQVIEDALTYIALSEGIDNPQIQKDDVSQVYARFCRLPIYYFKGADLGLLYEEIAVTNHERLFFGVDNAESRKDLSRVDLGFWDSCIACYENEPPVRDGATYLFTLRRIRKVSLREVRGMFQAKTGDIIESANAQVYNDGKYMVDRGFYERRGGVYHLVACPFEVRPAVPCDEGENMLYHLGKSTALTDFYEWRVHFGFAKQGQANIATVSLNTDPIGIREAFKLRDIPPGKSRREALKHWVATHFRKTKSREVEVHEHLRGAEEFTHRGLYCKIQPSAYDLRRQTEHKR